MGRKIDAALHAASRRRWERSEDSSVTVAEFFPLLARLGLRAGEVIALELDDLEWRAGVLTVRGKGRTLAGDQYAPSRGVLGRDRPDLAGLHVTLAARVGIIRNSA